MNEVFLDTAFVVAGAIPSDAFHSKAVQLGAELKRNRTRVVTTRGVMLEIGNALSKTHSRKTASLVLQSFEDDPRIEIVPLSEELYARAFRMYRERPDKEWGLVDCVSFVVMQERGITDALTTDEHFKQAGFRALMREP